ncbi:hypothetical protein [Streptomyces sp. AP-93]|uniref:hypothetical protein n=1 Tax=Streptomyces sp. AP-93 TaxID=2929048 RepID=UPI001FAE9003|nr:hypothetical protein [Streptomyces sp. AP-93]MCJ0868939.1 hypothetical protein [Streptomyces sp. AP-93]
MFDGNFHLYQSNGLDVMVNVAPISSGGPFKGKAKTTFTTFFGGTETLEVEFEGFWNGHHHTSFLIDWNKSTSKFARFYPYANVCRYMGYLSELQHPVPEVTHTLGGGESQSAWCGQLVDLANHHNQALWYARGPVVE